MRIFYALSYLFLFFPLIVSAQGYSPGYIVTVKGDTIKGFIGRHEWDSNPNSVSFKDGSQSEIHSYTPADIKQFTIDSLVTYKSFACKISLATVDENHLYPRDTSSRFDTVFMQILQTGKNVDLMSYSDDIKTRYYVLEKNGSQPQELIYRVYLRNEPGENRTENIFIQQLNDLALKYNALTDKLIKELSNLEYREHKIVKIISLINGLAKPQTVKKRTKFYKLGLAAVILGFVSYMVYSNVRF